MIEAVTESYNSPDNSETENKPISKVVEELNITPLKAYKLLVIGVAYETTLGKQVCTLYHGNKTIAQIRE